MAALLSRMGRLQLMLRGAQPARRGLGRVPVLAMASGARGLCAVSGAERASALIEHIKRGDEDLAREMVAELVASRQPIDFEFTDPYGSTALTLASRGGHLELARQLLSLDLPAAVLNAQNIFGSTALMCAAASGHAHVCTELLERPAVEVNIRTQYGSSALSKAAEAGHSAIVQQLLARGAEVAPNKLGKTPAELALAKGHTSVAVVLQPITPQRDPISKPPPKVDPARQPLVHAHVCGVRANNVVCRLDTAVQGPPGTVIAARGEGLPKALPLNERVMLRRDPSVLPAGWLIVEVCAPEAGVKKAKQKCLHPRRPFNKKCVDCPDKRLN